MSDFEAKAREIFGETVPGGQMDALRLNTIQALRDAHNAALEAAANEVTNAAMHSQSWLAMATAVRALKVEKPGG